MHSFHRISGIELLRPASLPDPLQRAPAKSPRGRSLRRGRLRARLSSARVELQNQAECPAQVPSSWRSRVGRSPGLPCHVSLARLSMCGPVCPVGWSQINSVRERATLVDVPTTLRVITSTARCPHCAIGDSRTRYRPLASTRGGVRAVELDRPALGCRFDTAARRCPAARFSLASADSRAEPLRGEPVCAGHFLTSTSHAFCWTGYRCPTALVDSTQ